MNIIVEKTNKRFSVKSKYDVRLLSVIQSIDKKFWDNEKLVWTLPIESYDEFESEVSQIPGMNIEVIEKKPHAILTKVDDNIEVKFGQFIDQFGLFKEIENIQYDKDSRKLIMGADHLPKLLSVFKQLNMSYFYNKEKEEDLDFIAELPIKIGEKFKKKTKYTKCKEQTMIR